MVFCVEVFDLVSRAWAIVSESKKSEQEARALYDQAILDHPLNSVRCIQLLAQHNAVTATGGSIEEAIKEHPEAYEAGKKDRAAGVANRGNDWDFEINAKVAYQAGYAGLCLTGD